MVGPSSQSIVLKALASLNLNQEPADKLIMHQSISRMNLFSLIGLLALALAPMALSAQERLEFYQGIRQMGMGGASIAVVNDETALLSNPAALSKLRDHFVTVIDPEIAVGSEVERVAGLNILDIQDPQEALNRLNDGNQNRYLSTRAQIFPSIVLPNFGIGFYGRQMMNAQIDTDSDQFLFNSLQDYSLVTGVSFRFWQGRIKLGGNARVTNRTELRGEFATTAINLDRNTLAREGIGIGSDIGLILSAPWQWLPTLSAVWRDVGSTSYTYRDGLLLNKTDLERPARTEDSLDLAVALFPLGGKYTRWSWTLEYRDALSTETSNQQLRRVHFGGEVNIADSIFLRAGVNQGYWTGGLELTTPGVQFQLATFGTEVGLGTLRREDRRYSIKLSYRF